MAIKTFASGEILTASDTNTYLANAGLVYVTSTTIGSAVSSVTVSNCFSSTYDNYRIVLQGIVNSTAANLEIQLSGITSTTYSMGGVFFTYGSATVSGYGPAASTKWLAVAAAGTTNSQAMIDVMAPNAATTKALFTQASSTASYYSLAGTCTSTSTATGFVLTPSGGTMTGGTITVYGYRKA